jgi:hypothetical protein
VTKSWGQHKRHGSRKQERAGKRLPVACGLFHGGFVSQLFNRRGLRQATIDETGVSFDLLNKETKEQEVFHS